MHHVKTNCSFCGYLCALTATVDEGDVVSIEPDETRYPYDKHIMWGCARWKNNLNVLHSEDRINYPMRRVGERGSGTFERVTWDEALEDITTRLQDLIEKNGPQTLASAIGGPHTVYWPLHRFMNILGSPNNMGIGQICWNANVLMNTLTFGWSVESDIRPGVSGCVVLWGTNPAESDNSRFWRMILDLGQAGTPLVVVDPRRTAAARRAQVHLQIQPGSDVTLALGLMHLLFAEHKVDEEFLATWCIGVEELKAHVAPYTPGLVAHACGIDEGDLRKAADLLGISPVAIHSGRGIDQLAADTESAHRALAILRALTGSVDVPGGNHICESPRFVDEYVMEGSDKLGQAARDLHLNSRFTPLQSPVGYDKLRARLGERGAALPMRYITSAHPDLVWNAMLKGDPYPIRALIVMGADPVMTFADTHRVVAAMNSLDLMVVLEQYMTPTAQLADYVLPVAGALESVRLHAQGGVANLAYGGPAAVKPLFERKDDYTIFRELALLMGQPHEEWKHETFEEALGEMFAPAGVTWDDFVQTGIVCGEPFYHKHFEVLPTANEYLGFATPTGKIELTCALLEELGGHALPVPLERPALKDGELLLMTGARKQPYYASSYFEHEAFRQQHPEPLAEIDPITAQRCNLKEGDAVLVKTDLGSAQFTVRLAPMAHDVISVEYGWWYPEQQPGLPQLSGAFVSNPNVLTSASIKKFAGSVGTWSYNGLPCTIEIIGNHNSPETR